MGGRLDSTNIIRNPLLSVITGIALDHVAFLGDTPEKIAAEKAGIIKDLAPVLYGGDDPLAGKVIENRAKEMGSSYHTVPYETLHIHRSDLNGTHFDFGEHQGLEIALLGSYQPRNASLVVTAVEILRERGLDISEKALREGLALARWQARFEIISRDPLTIFDGAHNPQGIDSAVASIKQYFGDEKVYVLTGVLRDKDYEYIATRLSEIAEKAFTLTPDNPRALSAEEYAEVLCKNGVLAKGYDSLENAYEIAKHEAQNDGKALVCLGSLYTYAELIKLI